MAMTRDEAIRRLLHYALDRLATGHRKSEKELFDYLPDDTDEVLMAKARDHKWQGKALNGLNLIGIIKRPNNQRRGWIVEEDLIPYVKKIAEDYDATRNSEVIDALLHDPTKARLDIAHWAAVANVDRYKLNDIEVPDFDTSAPPIQYVPPEAEVEQPEEAEDNNALPNVVETITALTEVVSALHHTVLTECTKLGYAVDLSNVAVDNTTKLETEAIAAQNANTEALKALCYAIERLEHKIDILVIESTNNTRKSLRSGVQLPQQAVGRNNALSEALCASQNSLIEGANGYRKGVECLLKEKTDLENSTETSKSKT